MACETPEQLDNVDGKLPIAGAPSTNIVDPSSISGDMLGWFCDGIDPCADISQDHIKLINTLFKLAYEKIDDNNKDLLCNISPWSNGTTAAITKEASGQWYFYNKDGNPSTNNPNTKTNNDHWYGRSNTEGFCSLSELIDYIIMNQLIGSSCDNIGLVSAFATNVAPECWIEANGAEVSRSSYSDLFSVIGATFGSGNGSTTFNIPDMRGLFLRGWDNGRGIDTGRAFGSYQEDEIEAFTQYRYQHELLCNHFRPDGAARTHHSETQATIGGDETRPKNLTLLYCIKWK